ncbi:uncharacterized protein LOC120637558 [Pararge aegeria]|uniref:uncharacterized protein LOC120637558 n=1 Tax=Pararge aegeria TaxID=116150 RepID=UPI0019D07812|nr:uncharacterized protein LOC120637558 [Pararge aegeria]
MKAVLFACVLAIAGVSAMPQDTVPAQGRFVDLWVRDVVDRYRARIGKYDPLAIEKHEFDTTVVPGLLFLKGFVENSKFVGHSGLYVNRAVYNILLGQLVVEISFPKISMEIGNYKVEGRYGDRGGEFQTSGSLTLTNLRFNADTLLVLLPGLPVSIYNINTALYLGNIEADVEASWKCLGCREPRDISSCANNILNRRIPEWLVTYEYEIGTIMGEGIRRFVNWYW